MAGPRPAGSQVHLTYDSAQILEPGDYLRTGSGRLYLIEGNRIQERGRWAGRQHLTAVVMEPRSPVRVGRTDLVDRLVSAPKESRAGASAPAAGG
jgi:hypothetical protein